MDADRKKILVALDGSGHSLNAVHYLGRIVPPDRAWIVLFSVYAKTPERFWDMEESPPASPTASGADEWEIQQKKALGDFLENARQSLLNRGFPPDAVTIKTQERQVGIARDILQEAQAGYHAVVAGRQGMNPITRLVIGSVAAKLIASLASVPLWLVGGGAADSNRLLVAIDGSDNALRAVEYVGDLLGGADIAVTLFQVVRSFDFKLPGPDEHFFTPPETAGRPDESREVQKVRGAFETAARALEDRGVEPRRITTKIISGVATRSGTMIAQAVTGGYGTIVVGRRGHSRVGEFHMGRVSNKIIQLAGKTAVWLVS